MAAVPVSVAAKMAAVPVSVAAKMAAVPVSGAAKMAAVTVSVVAQFYRNLPLPNRGRVWDNMSITNPNKKE